MASLWVFASTRGLIFLADAHSADPEELQVLDTSLPTKLVVRASSPGFAPRHTEGCLKMTPSPRLLYTQHSNKYSHIPVLGSQPRPGQITLA